MHAFRFLLVLALLTTAHAARAEITQCTGISSLPTTISSQGIYCLKQDLSTAITSGNAITVTTNNVTIDCNEHKLGGLGGGTATQANGIYTFSHLNLTVRNCNVRGFRTGILIDSNCGSCDASGALVEHNLLDANTKQGIYVVADNSIIRENRVVNTGGSILGGDVIGIRAHGLPTFVFDNIVSTTTGPSFAADTIGIWYSGYMSTARDNVVANTIKGSNGESAGLRAGGTTITAEHNLITNTSSPLTYGIDVVYGAVCLDNRVFGATNKYDTCTNGGGNYP